MFRIINTLLLLLLSGEALACGDSGPNYIEYVVGLIAIIISLAAITLPYCILHLHSLVKPKVTIIGFILSASISSLSIILLTQISRDLYVAIILVAMVLSIAFPYLYLLFKTIKFKQNHI